MVGETASECRNYDTYVVVFSVDDESQLLTNVETTVGVFLVRYIYISIYIAIFDHIYPALQGRMAIITQQPYTVKQ